MEQCPNAHAISEPIKYPYYGGFVSIFSLVRLQVMITSAPNGPIAALVFSVDLEQTLLLLFFFPDKLGVSFPSLFHN